MAIPEELLKKCIKGDQQASKALYKELAGTLFAICCRYTKNRTEAEDWLQESFIKIFTNLHNFKFEGSFEGWAKRITVNHIISDFKKKKALKNSFDVDDFTEQLGSLEVGHSKLEYEELLGFINLLPEGKRLVFNLAAIEGYSHKEIGELLNINESTSRGQLTKAKEMLIQIHKKHNYFNAKQIS
jgi:RNA polymerase sigma-70 factor (ECF subfamily)